MSCKNCGKSISDEVAFGPECGTPCRQGEAASAGGSNAAGGGSAAGDGRAAGGEKHVSG